MIDRLIDFILSSLKFFQFLEVVNAYQQGVVLRFGRFHRVLMPGIHWVWPFYLEHVMTDTVVKAVRQLGARSLTTKDGVNVVVGSVITFETSDIRKLLLEVDNAEAALSDAALGIVSREVFSANFADLITEEFADRVTKAVRRKAWQYGIEVNQIQLCDVSRARSIRLWQQSDR